MVIQLVPSIKKLQAQRVSGCDHLVFRDLFFAFASSSRFLTPDFSFACFLMFHLLPVFFFLSIFLCATGGFDDDMDDFDAIEEEEEEEEEEEGPPHEEEAEEADKKVEMVENQ